MDKVDVGVLIGRFQPIHIGHCGLIKDALTKCNKLIIIIGSAFNQRTLSNPFLSHERIDMIKLCLDYDEIDKIIFCPLRDFNNIVKWTNAVNEIVLNNSKEKNTIGLFGFKKDDSSFYLSLFPDYKNMMVETSFGKINATDVRKKLFSAEIIDIFELHADVLSYLHKHFEFSDLGIKCKSACNK